MFFVQIFGSYSDDYHLHGYNNKGNEKNEANPHFERETNHQQHQTYQNRSQCIGHKKRIKGFQKELNQEAHNKKAVFLTESKKGNKWNL